MVRSNNEPNVTHDSKPIEVGTPVARRPPRRSRRAEFPHRAPQSDAHVERRPGLVVSWWTFSCMLWCSLSSGPWRRGLVLQYRDAQRAHFHAARFRYPLPLHVLGPVSPFTQAGFQIPQIFRKVFTILSVRHSVDSRCGSLFEMMIGLAE